MRFIHAADLHIDSPLRGLEQYAGAPSQRLREATRDALRNLVQLAIEQSVDFVVVAGDLFDGQWLDMQTGLVTANEFRRLANENIDLYFIRGNHDAASKLQKSMRWPENVHELSAERPDTIVRDDLGVALHGQGFATPDVLTDLVADYPPPLDGLFNIGLLHTSLTGDPQHDTYAPTSEDALVARGYQYWALGHIHNRRTVRESPYIAFSGNTQGRHIRETGAKGCLLVEVNDHHELQQVTFHAIDTLRWHLVRVDLQDAIHLDGVLSCVRDQLDKCRGKSDGRFTAARVILGGASPMHNTLMRSDQQRQIVAEIRNLANEWDEDVWVEKVKIETVPTVDIDQLRRGEDLLGELFRHLQHLANDHQTVVRLAHEMPDMTRFSPELKEAGIDFDDIQRLREWLGQVEGLLVSQLLEPRA